MKGKLYDVWNRVRYFCITQTNHFYIGMGLAVGFMLSLTKYVIPWLAMVLSIALPPLAYVAVRGITESPKNWKIGGEFGRNVLALMMGVLWVLLISMI